MGKKEQEDVDGLAASSDWQDSAWLDTLLKYGADESHAAKLLTRDNTG